MYIKNKASNGSNFAPSPKKNPHRDHEKNKKKGGLIENTYLSFFSSVRKNMPYVCDSEGILHFRCPICSIHMPESSLTRYPPETVEMRAFGEHLNEQDCCYECCLGLRCRHCKQQYFDRWWTLWVGQTLTPWIHPPHRYC